MIQKLIQDFGKELAKKKKNLVQKGKKTATMNKKQQSAANLKDGQQKKREFLLQCITVC